MKIGISTASFFTKEATENTFEIINDIGFDLCEVFLTTFSEYKKTFIEELAIRKKELQVFSVHSLNVQFEPELFITVKRTKEDSEYFFKQVATGAGILGAKYYTFHGLAILKKLPYTLDLQRIGKRMDELDEMLAEYGNGCHLAYENVHWTCFNSPEFFTQFRKYSNVKTCLDIKQAMQSKYDIYDYIDSMEGRLANVHLCDFDDDGKLFMPGKGRFDFTKLFRYLIDKGYNGPVIMEIYANNYNNYDEIKQGYEYLKECMEKAYS